MHITKLSAKIVVGNSGSINTVGLLSEVML